jgi:hypothetical protein
MAATYILTIDDFLAKADLSQNINTNKLNANIGVVQDVFGRKVLCNQLVDELLSQLPNSLTDANEALLPYVKNFLIYKTYSDYLIGANLMSTPAGMRVQIDTTSDQASDKSMVAIQRRADGRADFYQDQLINFLKENEDDYPLWKASICNCYGNRRPQNGNVFSRVGSQDRRVDIDFT